MGLLDLPGSKGLRQEKAERQEESNGPSFITVTS